MSLQNITKEKATSADVDQYAACTISSNTVAEAAAVTANVFGVAQNTASSGNKVNLVISGKTKCLVDGSGTAIAAGDELSPSATAGVLVKHAGTATHTYVAKALDPATTAGAVIEVFLYGSDREA